MKEKNEKKYVESLMEKYSVKEVTSLDELKALDKKVCKPVKIFAYTFGSVGALLLGIGMCATMKQLPQVILDHIPSSLLFTFGLIIGIIGIAAVSLNYFLYKKILNVRKAKYAEQIINLSNTILNK